jgi:hypothetical protein
MVTTASCLANFSSNRWADALQKRWTTRCTVDLDRSNWVKLFVWIAGSRGLNEQVEARLVDARRRYALLVDRRFTEPPDEAAQKELAQLELLLDAADAPFYAPIKERLRAIRDSLAGTEEPGSSGEGA